MAERPRNNLPIRVLVTRPKHQQADFIRLCEAAGFDTVSLPCVELRALPRSLQHQQLAQCNVVIFTSGNAVRYAHAICPLPWPDIKVLAIGPATMRCLNQHQQALVHPPVEPYNSEALLDQLSTWQHFHSAAIITGAGGRQLLQTTLRERGIKVLELAVYERLPPKISEAELHTALVERPPHIISVTSKEILLNLVAAASKNHSARLLQMPLVVNSESCAELASRLGFTQPALLAVPVGDPGQIQAVQNWHQSADYAS